MMDGLRQLIFGNWPLKLAALGLAVVLYAGVSLSESTRTWTGPVRIEVLNSPAGAALLDDPGVVDRIDYLASDEVARQLTNESFRASIDLGSVKPRAGLTTVEVPVDVYPVDPRVRVVGYEPPGVTVRIDEVISRSFPVTVDHSTLPEGIELGPVVIEPPQATVSGASSRLQNVRTVAGHFVVDASGINIDEDVTIEAYDEAGVTVPGVDVLPSSVRVTADVQRRLAYATVPVVPELVGEPAHGYRVKNVSVLPATVTVSGQSQDVRSLASVSTTPVDISGQSIELVTDASLVLPQDVTSLDTGPVTVLVTFTQIEASRSYEVGTTITGARSDYSYRLDQPSLSVVISGPLTELDGMSVADLSVEIPVGGLEVGENEVMPIVHSPRGTSVVSTDPASVRVTVSAPS
jgi:YbbR domain-containing protein